MPESRPLILKRVCRMPVTAPASGRRRTRRPASRPAGDHAVHQQHRGDRRAERDRAVRGDVGKAEDAEADEHAERQQRQDQPDGQRAEQQGHVSRAPPSTSRIGPIQQAPRTNSLSPGADDRAVVVQQVQHALQGSPSNSADTVGCSSIAPLRSGRYGNAAAWKWPASADAVRRAAAAAAQDRRRRIARAATPTTRARLRPCARSGVNDSHSRICRVRERRRPSAGAAPGERRSAAPMRPADSATMTMPTRVGRRRPRDRARRRSRAAAGRRPGSLRSAPASGSRPRTRARTARCTSGTSAPADTS